MSNRVAKPIEPHRFFMKGQSFHFAGRWIMGQDPSLLGVLSFPAVVSMAFTCEAYLKVLAVLEGKPRPLKTHNLLHLVQDTSPASQAAMESDWLRLMLPDIEKTRDKMPAWAVQPQTFRQALEMSASAFVDWRYAPAEAHISFHVSTVQDSARELILALKPEWQPDNKTPLVALNPQPEVVEPENDRLGSVAPGSAVLNRKAAPLDGGGSANGSANPKNGGSD